MLFPTVSDFGVFFPHIKVFNFVPSKVSVFALLLPDFESLEKISLPRGSPLLFFSASLIPSLTFSGISRLFYKGPCRK